MHITKCWDVKTRDQLVHELIGNLNEYNRIGRRISTVGAVFSYLKFLNKIYTKNKIKTLLD